MSGGGRWFKFYEGALDDPKVQRLPPDVFKGWVNILCLASKGKGELPSIGDIAFALRITDREADSLVMALVSAGLLDDFNDCMMPHNWQERQGVDLTAADRMRRYRERKKDERNDRNALRVTPVTATAIEEKRKEERREDAREARDPSLLIFPKDGTIEYTPWAAMSRAAAPGADPDHMASEFRKFCHGKDMKWDEPGISKAFATFCRSQRKSA